MSRSDSTRRLRPSFAIAAHVFLGLLALVTAAGDAPAGQKDTVTIGFLVTPTSKPGWDLLIPNFERAYPNIHVDMRYVPNNTTLYQVETTQLAAGNAPELLATNPGCGTPIAVCVMAKAGHLASMVNKPWAEKARPGALVTSYAKYGKTLFAFVPQLGPHGIATNDSMFRRLGLKIPQTYSQLLDVCGKAKAAGTSAVISHLGSGSAVSGWIFSFAASLVYAKDRHWTAKLKAGKVTFAGSSGWRQAMQRFIGMNDAGCFQPGATGVTSGNAGAVLFAQGQGLMRDMTSNQWGLIVDAKPAFSYSFHRMPTGTRATDTTTSISLLQGVSVNAHASAEKRAAAQTFVDFIARPKQNALFTKASGGLTQSQFRTGQVPAYMSSMRTVFSNRKYIISPAAAWWNPDVSLALQQNGIGLITGQRSIDEVLTTMDAAWQKGPS